LKIREEVEKTYEKEVPVRVLRTLIMKEVGIEERTIQTHLKRMLELNFFKPGANMNFYTIVAHQKKTKKKNGKLNKQENDILSA